jgi:tetratricopeptide (TPR) repeat protein/tRNA A-37 threonylcarbamoyl transferase component Bud32
MDHPAAQPPPATPADAIPPATAQGTESLLDARNGANLPGGDGAAPTEGIERPGTRIGGRYKLLQQIGEGGMGAVFMAEQETPVRRRVALKIVKPGMDTRQVVARFEAERQALAMMDHPNIARALDGGATETGRPYFVMELVQGVPITDYCDKQQLTPRERLELFVPVCHALQHAHQKGIIHRDVKPSNVLVAICDGTPVPKVIDFGVAKALHQRLTEKTLFTQFGGVVGTFEYMSPEQADSDVFAADTRSDVYSLGVLLYELLTGTTPLQRKDVQEAGWAEMLRLIREAEPPKPSTRISQSGDALAGISSRRHTEPHKLERLLKGDLDWIALKAEKDRSRRYETASALAKDVERHLADEPVEACPPSAGYRLRQLARRYRRPLAVAAAVFMSLSIGLALATAGWARAGRDRDAAVKSRAAEAEQRQKAEDALALAERRRIAAEADALQANVIGNFMTVMLTSADPYQHPGRDVTVRQVLDSATKKLDDGQLASQPEAEGLARLAVGRTYLELSLLVPAEKQVVAALEQVRRLYGTPHRFVAGTLLTLADVRFKQGRFNEAGSLLREALAMESEFGVQRDHLRSDILNSLALIAQARGDHPAAERLLREVLEYVRKRPGADDEGVAIVLLNLSRTLLAMEKLDEAESTCREVLRILHRLSGDQHPDVARVQAVLADILLTKGDRQGAADLRREAFEAYRKTWGDDHSLTVEMAGWLADLLTVMDDRAASKKLLAEHYSRLQALPSSSATSQFPLVERLVSLYDGNSPPDQAAVWKSRLRVLFPLWIDEQISRINHVVRDRPDDPQPLRARGLLHGRASRFKAAAADWARATEVRPSEDLQWYMLSCLLAYLDDTEAYKSACESALTLFGDSDSYVANVRIAGACALLAYPGQDSTRLRQMAARALAVAKSTGTDVPWAEFTAAVVEYRSGDGHYELALQHVAQARPAIRHEEMEVALDLLRCMALHRMGRLDEARAAYKDAAAEFERRVAVAGVDDLDNGGFVQWLVCQVLHREAGSLIAGRVQPTTARAAKE